MLLVRNIIFSPLSIQEINREIHLTNTTSYFLTFKTSNATRKRVRFAFFDVFESNGCYGVALAMQF